MKVFLISHIADLDGVMPVVLTDLAFEDYDYQLLDIKDVDGFVKDSLDNNKFDDYDLVIMTDLCISESLAQTIDNTIFKNKFIVLDHHYTNLKLNSFSFINVVDEVNGIKESGTSLYYQYLIKKYPNELLTQESVAYMTTLTRLADTWQWQEFNMPEARDLSGLLTYYGNEKFITHYTNFLRKNKEFYFTEPERILLEVDKKRKDEYIDKFKNGNIIIRKIKDYNVGIVFAENYRSELGNELSSYYEDQVDLIMIINLNRSFSFRCTKDNVNVSEFASIFGGKGHVKSSGAPLPDNIKEDIVDLIIREIK